jgi:amino-acid N-acetyltransferase
MKIRKAKKEDYKSITDLCAKQKNVILFPIPKCSKFVVADEKGKIVGCCALEIYSPKIAEIRALAVEEKYRSYSIGRTLIDKCLEKGRGTKEIIVITSIPGYFKKLGFDFFQKEKYILFKKLY